MCVCLWRDKRDVCVHESEQRRKKTKAKGERKQKEEGNVPNVMHVPGDGARCVVDCSVTIIHHSMSVGPGVEKTFIYALDTPNPNQKIINIFDRNHVLLSFCALPIGSCVSRWHVECPANHFEHRSEDCGFTLVKVSIALCATFVRRRYISAFS